MSMKFGLLIDVDLRKRVTSSNTKPEVVWSRGRHLEIVYDVITPPWVARFGRFTAIWSKSQREEEFQYGGRLFFQTGSRLAVISQPWIKIPRRNLVCG